MHRNQHTSSNASQTFSLRIPPDLRDRLNNTADAQKVDRADIVRDALRVYLPTLECLPVKESTS